MKLSVNVQLEVERHDDGTMTLTTTDGNQLAFYRQGEDGMVCGQFASTDTSDLLLDAVLDTFAEYNRGEGSAV